MAKRSEPDDGSARGTRAAWVPAGMLVGADPVGTLARATEQPREPLVRLRTDAGELTSTPYQQLYVRKPGNGGPGSPYRDPEWLPAYMIRLGHHLCRRHTSGRDQWYQVVEVAQLSPAVPLHRIETDAETVEINGFVARTLELKRA